MREHHLYLSNPRDLREEDEILDCLFARDT